MPTRAFIQRLQKHYAYFKRHNGEKIPSGCSSIELIDEDDLKSWFVQLAYKDDNGSDFFISLKINFSEDESNEYVMSGKTPRVVKNPDIILSNHIRETPTGREKRNSDPPLARIQENASSSLTSWSISGNNFASALESTDNAMAKNRDCERGEKRGDGDLNQLAPVAATTSELSSHAMSSAATLSLGNRVSSLPDKVIYTRMPSVLVICPRLNASFIHHGVVCSLELMSQCWEHTEENVALLITTLYHTLNPFDGTNRISVGTVALAASDSTSEPPLYETSRYTDEEHHDGLCFIARSHPHLFRQAPWQHVRHSAYIENSAPHKSSDEIVDKYPLSQGLEREGARSSMKRPRWLHLSTIEEVKYVIYQGFMPQSSHSASAPTDVDVKLKDGTPLEDFKATLNIAALLRHALDLSHAQRDDRHASTSARTRGVGGDHREESLRVTVALPRSLTSVSHTSFSKISARANLCDSSTLPNEGTKISQRMPMQIVLDVLLPPCYSGALPDSTANGQRFSTFLDPHDHASVRIVKAHISGRSANEDDTPETLSTSPHLHFPVALVLRQGEALFCRPQGNGDLKSPPEYEAPHIDSLSGDSCSANENSKDVAMVSHCIVSEGLSLTLSDVDVYGHLTVHGHLHLRNCRFIGTITCVMNGQVQVESCQVGIDIKGSLIDVMGCITFPDENEGPIDSTELPSQASMYEEIKGVALIQSSHGKKPTQLPHRHEGILILDASRFEISEATLVSCAEPLLLASVPPYTADKTTSKGYRCGKILGGEPLISEHDSVKLSPEGNMDLEIDPPPIADSIGKKETLNSSILSLLSDLASFSPAIAEKLHNRHLGRIETSCCWLCPVLSALIFVSNSAKLFVHDSCLFPSSGLLSKFCKRIIFAEQNARVDINHSTIVASYVGAVCIQSCQALLHDVRIMSWRHYAAMATRESTNSLGEVLHNKQQLLRDFRRDDHDEDLVSHNRTVLPSPAFKDTERSTGLVVEQGGSLTACHCIVKGLYFGFSVTTFSVAHFHSCHASHVVNGYTVDASTANFENCSAWSNHVGVFVLNQAKCEIIEYSDGSAIGGSFEERCAAVNQACCKTRQRGHTRRAQKQYQKCALRGNSTHTSCSHKVESFGPEAQRVELDKESESWTTSGFKQNRTAGRSSVGKHFLNRGMRCYYGETYGIEVRGAIMKAKGITVINAKCACVYVYPQYGGQPARQGASEDGPNDNLENDVSVCTPSEVDLQECILWGLPTQSHSLRSERAVKLENHRGSKSCPGNTNTTPIDTLNLTKFTCKPGDFYDNDVEDFNMMSNISLIPTSLGMRKPHSGFGSSDGCHENFLVSYNSDDECGVKLIGSKAKLYRCFAVELDFAFVVMQQATAKFEECMAVRGYIGFIVKDNSVATLCDSGSYMKCIALLVQKHSHVDIDWVPLPEKEAAMPNLTSSSQTLNEPVSIPLMKQTKPGKTVSGFPTNVFMAGLNGIECKASVVRCHSIAVLQVSGSAFNVHGGSILHLNRSLVDLSTEGSVVYLTQRLTRREIVQGGGMDRKEACGTVGVNHSDNFLPSGETGIIGGCSCGTCLLQLLDIIKNVQDTALSYTIGIKAWSRSMCYVDDTEIRNGMYGAVAIGPEARVHANHIHIWDVQHGLKVESAAEANFINCCINSLQDAVHISANARCLIQQGSYTGRLFGVVCTYGSLLRIKKNVKVGGFSRAGIYLHESAIMETEKGSQLEVKENCTDDPQEQRSGNSYPSSLSGVEPRNPSVCVLLESHANAKVHCAFLGGGAAYGIRAQSGSFGFFQCCVIEDVRLIGLHILPASIVFIGSGSTIDVLDAMVETGEETRLGNLFTRPPEATLVISSLHAYPYSLVVERGAVCRFLPPANTPQSLPDCRFNLPLWQSSNTSLGAFRSRAVCFIRLFNPASHINTLWGWIATRFLPFKTQEQTQSVPLETHTSRFFRWAESSIHWTLQTLASAYLRKAVLFHEGKNKAKVYLDRETKIAILSTKNSPPDTLTNNVSNKTDINSMGRTEDGSVFNHKTKVNYSRVSQCHNTSALKPMRPTSDTNAFRPWSSQMLTNKTLQQMPLLSTTSRISGRSVICGECSLCEVSLQLPVCSLSSASAVSDLPFTTSRLLSGKATDPAVLPEKEEGWYHHREQALESLESKNINDGYGCPCNAAVTIRDSGDLTLRRCSLVCLPSPPLLSSASGLAQLDFHLVCCSGASARLHLCGAHIKLYSPKRGVSECTGKVMRERSPPFSVGPCFYSCNKMIIHAVNGATLVLCCVTNEGLNSPLEPYASLCQKEKEGRTEASHCQLDPAMVPNDPATVKHESLREDAHGNVDTRRSRALFYKGTHIQASSVPLRALIHLNVHACGQSTVHVYRSFLHHLLAGHNSKLTIIQSAIAGPGSVTDIQSGAVLDTQKSLLLSSLVDM